VGAQQNQSQRPEGRDARTRVSAAPPGWRGTIPGTVAGTARAAGVLRSALRAVQPFGAGVGEIPSREQPKATLALTPTLSPRRGRSVAHRVGDDQPWRAERKPREGERARTDVSDHPATTMGNLATLRHVRHTHRLPDR